MFLVVILLPKEALL